MGESNASTFSMVPVGSTLDEDRLEIVLSLIKMTRVPGGSHEDNGARDQILHSRIGT